MIDLSTSYMGMALKSPLVPSAAPLSKEMDTLRQMEDAGASAVVLYSLFEEQIDFEALEIDHYLEYGSESFAESLSYFPEPREFRRGPEEYLDHIRKAKEALDVPIIASLNGRSPGGWTEYSKKFEQAGADAIELNVYFLPTDPHQPVSEIEGIYGDIVADIKKEVKIPIAVKMHPYFTSIPFAARVLVEQGADGLALFNRFYQPDIDPENLEVFPNLQLSTPWDSRLATRWLAILYGRIRADLAATGGVHSGRDAVKMLMAGAAVVHMTSALLKYGVYHLKRVEEELRTWMEENEYASVKQMVGVMSQKSSPDPAAFERANYIKVLQSYK